MKHIIKKSIDKVVGDLGTPKVEFSLQIPKNKDHGDLATNIAFILSKHLSEAPMIIASKITIKIKICPNFKNEEFPRNVQELQRN